MSVCNAMINISAFVTQIPISNSQLKTGTPVQMTDSRLVCMRRTWSVCWFTGRTFHSHHLHTSPSYQHWPRLQSALQLANAQHENKYQESDSKKKKKAISGGNLDGKMNHLCRKISRLAAEPGQPWSKGCLLLCRVMGYCLFYDKRPQTLSPNEAP